MNSYIVDNSWILMGIHVKMIVIVNNFILLIAIKEVILHSISIPLSLRTRN